MHGIILEHMLSYLLEMHSLSIQSLTGKTIRFSLQDFPVNIYFICANERIFVAINSNISADVTIKLKSSALLALLQGDDISDLLRQDKIIIHGDVKTVQLLLDLLQQTNIDFEELLSHYTGDIIAHKIGKTIQNIRSANNPIAAFKNKIVNLLINPIVK